MLFKLTWAITGKRLSPDDRKKVKAMLAEKHKKKRQSQPEEGEPDPRWEGGELAAEDDRSDGEETDASASSAFIYDESILDSPEEPAEAGEEEEPEPEPEDEPEQEEEEEEETDY